MVPWGYSSLTTFSFFFFLTIFLIYSLASPANVLAYLLAKVNWNSHEELNKADWRDHSKTEAVTIFIESNQSF